MARRRKVAALLLALGLMPGASFSADERWTLSVTSRPGPDLPDAAAGALSYLHEQLAGSLANDGHVVLPYVNDDVVLVIEVDLTATREDMPAGDVQWTTVIRATARNRETSRIEFTVGPNESRFREQADCLDACLSARFRAHVDLEAQNLTHGLTGSLDAGGFTYAIEFREFAEREIDALNAAIRRIPGYVGQSMRYEDARDRRELLHVRRTQTTLFEAQFGTGRLQSVLGDEFSALTIVEQRGRNLILQREGMPYIERYVGAAMAILLVIYMALVVSIWQRHGRAIAGFRSRNESSQGLSYVEGISAPLVPSPGSWAQAGNEFRHRKDDAERHLREARQRLAGDAVIDASDHTAAIQQQMAEVDHHVNAALEADADCAEARELRVTLPDLRKGLELCAEAQRGFHRDPGTAVRMAQEAIARNPNVAGRAQSIIAAGQAVLREERAEFARVQIASAKSAGKPYRAAATADSVLADLAGVAGLDSVVDEISELRASATSALTAPTTAVVRSRGRTLEVMLGAEFAIGRKSSNSPADIAIGYSRISRAERQSVLRPAGGGVAVTDLGGTNGTFVDDGMLAPDQSMSVRAERRSVISLGGTRVPEEKGICRLHCSLAPGQGQALFLRMDSSTFRFIDRTGLVSEWPSLDVDLKRHWLCLFPSGAADLFLDAQGGLTVEPEDGVQPAFRLAHGPGLMIGAIPGHEEGLRIDGELVRNLVPWSPGVRVECAAGSFELTEGALS